MKISFINKIILCWPVNLLFFVIFLGAGCNFTNFSKYNNLTLKPFKEIQEEKYRKIRNSEELTLEIEISSRVIISSGDINNSLEYLKARLNILPMINNRQKVSNLVITSPGKIVENAVEFKLENPSPGLHEFKLKGNVLFRHEFIKVKDKIPFPLNVIPNEQIKFIKPSVIIDSDDKEIRALASSIIQGEDDLYRVAFKLSKWVRENVQYHVDTTTIFTSQKASWVLENRKGVCDEKTNLFIGLLRSMKIPAKFVTGLMASNYNGTINFKPHGWAEVYFPSIGWVPFDVTINQLGYIDATHIKLSESVDTSAPLTSYEWSSIDISEIPVSLGGDSNRPSVSTKDLEIRADIKKRKGSITSLLEIKPVAWHKNISAGSYNVIEAVVENSNKFYVITDMHMEVPPDVKIMGENIKMVLVEPESTKNIYWIVKPTKDIARNRIATYPVNVVSSRGAIGSTKFLIAKEQGYRKYGYEKLKKGVEKKTGNAL